MPTFTPFFETLTDDSDVVRLLDASVGNLLTRNGYTMSRAPADIQNVAQHISDWITVAIRNKAPWLDRANSNGIPLKLAKCQTLGMLTKEANKAMRLALQRCDFATPIAGEEEVVTHLAAGYTLVRLRTDTALKREGFMMQHCIGLGAYDRALTMLGVEFLSLRDRMGKAHITVEVVNDKILQLKGKQNRSPRPEYLDLILPGLRDRNLGMDEQKTIDGLVEDEPGQLFSIYALPEGFRAKASIFANHLIDLAKLPRGLTAPTYVSLDGSGLKEVPDGLNSGSDLSIVRSKELVKIGTNVRVGGGLHIGGCSLLTTLPHDLHVVGSLYTRWNDIFGDPPEEDEFCDAIREIPASIYVGQDIYLNGCRSLRQFPEGIVIRKTLSIEDTAIEWLPERLVVPENLNLGGGHLLGLPKVLHVGKDLRVDLHAFGLLLAAIEARHDIIIGGSVYVENQPISINLKKYPDDDPQYKEWTDDGRYYFYNPPDDLPQPIPMWTEVPPSKRR
jgi:hypothetical protein